jgi:hypothetical protein
VLCVASAGRGSNGHAAAGSARFRANTATFHVWTFFQAIRVDGAVTRPSAP